MPIMMTIPSLGGSFASIVGADVIKFAGLVILLFCAPALACEYPDEGNLPLRRAVSKVKYLPDTEAWASAMHKRAPWGSTRCSSMRRTASTAAVTGRSSCAPTASYGGATTSAPTGRASCGEKEQRRKQPRNLRQPRQQRVNGRQLRGATAHRGYARGDGERENGEQGAEKAAFAAGSAQRHGGGIGRHARRAPAAAGEKLRRDEDRQVGRYGRKQGR